MAVAAFLGLFLGASPLLGVRSWLALLSATLVKVNRLYAYLLSHVTANWLVTPWVMLAEIQVAHRLRRGAWLALDVEAVRTRGAELALDWCLGWILVGGAVGAAGAVITLLTVAQRGEARRSRQAPSPPADTPATAAP
jgi:hypothetical protein